MISITTLIIGYSVNMVQKHISRVSYTCMICPADKVSCPAKVIQLIALVSNSKHFLYDFCVSHWPANIMWWWAKAINLIHLYFTYDHRSKVS